MPINYLNYFTDVDEDTDDEEAIESFFTNFGRNNMYFPDPVFSDDEEDQPAEEQVYLELLDGFIQANISEGYDRSRRVDEDLYEETDRRREYVVDHPRLGKLVYMSEDLNHRVFGFQNEEVMSQLPNMRNMPNYGDFDDEHEANRDLLFAPFENDSDSDHYDDNTEFEYDSFLSQTMSRAVVPLSPPVSPFIQVPGMRHADHVAFNRSHRSEEKTSIATTPEAEPLTSLMRNKRKSAELGYDSGDESEIGKKHRRIT